MDKQSQGSALQDKERCLWMICTSIVYGFANEEVETMIAAIRYLVIDSL